MRLEPIPGGIRVLDLVPPSTIRYRLLDEGTVLWGGEIAYWDGVQVEWPEA